MGAFYDIVIRIDRKLEEQTETILNLVVPQSHAAEYPADNKEMIVYHVYPGSLADAKRLYSILLQTIQELDSSVSIELVTSREKDWQNAWKSHFKPLHIGSRLSILPAWEEVDDQTNESVLYIDPGMAFGSGSHATTKCCLTLLERLVFPGISLLDVGTGSGILAIAARKLGAVHVDAIDNDPQAIEVAQDNAEQNGCDTGIRFAVESAEKLTMQMQYDIIVANITADVIMKMWDSLVRDQNSLRYVILSGVSEYRRKSFDTFLARRGVRPQEILSEGAWFTYLIHYPRD